MRMANTHTNLMRRGGPTMREYTLARATGFTHAETNPHPVPPHFWQWDVVDLGDAGGVSRTPLSVDS